MLTEKYRSPSDLPARIAVFPLRRAILLPRAALQLNVFEERYLEMLGDVMSGDRIIGMIQPIGSDESEESPQDRKSALRPVGCAGRVTSYQELEDGRALITLTGICRFETVGEAVADTAYRQFGVSYERFAGDLTVGLGEGEVDRPALLDVLRSYLDQKELGADWAAIRSASSEFLVNALSVISPYGVEEKQALLEAPDLKSRAEVLVALAEMEIATHGGSGGTLQ